MRTPYVLDMSNAFYKSHAQNAHVFTYSLRLHSFHKTVFDCFRSRFRTCKCSTTMYEAKATMRVTCQTHFAKLDSQRAPLHFKHKHNELNAHFARKPRWTIAEQAHKGAHTYKSAHNALHTCATCAFTHCSGHIAHVCMCDAMHIFTHDRACPLTIKPSIATREFYSWVAHAIASGFWGFGCITCARFVLNSYIVPEHFQFLNRFREHSNTVLWTAWRHTLSMTNKSTLRIECIRCDWHAKHGLCM